MKNNIKFWLSGWCSPPVPAPGALTCLRPVLMWHSSMSCHQPLVRNICEKPQLGFLLRASGPFLNSDLDLGYSVSLSTAARASCALLFQVLWELWERSLLAAPCPTLLCLDTVKHPFWSSQSRKPQWPVCCCLHNTLSWCLKL